MHAAGSGWSSSAARGRRRGRVVRLASLEAGTVATALSQARLRDAPSPRRRARARRWRPAQPRAGSRARRRPAVRPAGGGRHRGRLGRRDTGLRPPAPTAHHRRRVRPGRRDHRPIGKNCEIGRLGATKFTFPPMRPCRPSLLAHRRDPLGHQGRQAPWRAPEHDPSVERRRPAALLPDQSAWRPALPAG